MLQHRRWQIRETKSSVPLMRIPANFLGCINAAFQIDMHIHQTSDQLFSDTVHLYAFNNQRNRGRRNAIKRLIFYDHSRVGSPRPAGTDNANLTATNPTMHKRLNQHIATLQDV